MSINNIILRLNSYWHNLGYDITPPYDAIMGAATFHPITFFSSIDNQIQEVKIAYAQRCRRPGDKLSFNSKNMFYQYQVIMKPYPDNFIDLYIKSLNCLKPGLKSNDIALLEDNWKSPTICAYGKGWEVNFNGYEITQLTSLDTVGGISCRPSVGEIAYGIDRMSSLFYDEENKATVSELLDDRIDSESSRYGSINTIKDLEICLSKCDYLIQNDSLFEAYDVMIEANNILNLLIAKDYFSHDYQTYYVLKLNKISQKIANKYLKSFNQKD